SASQTRQTAPTPIPRGGGAAGGPLLPPPSRGGGRGGSLPPPTTRTFTPTTATCLAAVIPPHSSPRVADQDEARPVKRMVVAADRLRVVGALARLDPAARPARRQVFGEFPHLLGTQAAQPPLRL